MAGHVSRSIETKQKVLEEGIGGITAAGLAIAELLEKGNKLLLCGNGGSASDAQHIATEFLIRYKGENERPSLPALSLAADSSALTAGSNDFGFDKVFSRQVEGLGQAGDGILAITTSGNSVNVLEALKVAREKKMLTVLLTGQDGGKIVREHSDLVDHVIKVPATETSRIQECHIMIGQIFCAVVEKKLYNMD